MNFYSLGLLLGEALEDAMKTFNEAKAGITTKTYDYLDQRNVEFDEDFTTFFNKANDLKANIAAIIEQNFSNVWETPQGIRFLVRFEKVSRKMQELCKRRFSKHFCFFR